MPYGSSTKLIRTDIIIREIRKKTIPVGANSDFTCVSCKFYSLPQKDSGRTREGLGKAHQKPRRSSCGEFSSALKRLLWRPLRKRSKNISEIMSDIEKGNINKWSRWGFLFVFLNTRTRRYRRKTVRAGLFSKIRWPFSLCASCP